MPLSKTQIQYLTNKLRLAHAEAKGKFAKDNPFAWDSKEVKQKLVDAGFVVNEYSYVKDVHPPLTEEMLRNKDKVDNFNRASDVAYNEALDTLNLGGADEALTLLREFTAKLAELAR